MPLTANLVPGPPIHPPCGWRWTEPRLKGAAAAWSNAEVLLLARNGFLFSFAPQQATDYRVVSTSFRPFSQSEMRGQLLREFGKQYEVSGTGNYLVVHPSGQRGRWAERFEDLFRSFVHYFSVRGMRPAAPTFPLVAVVLPSQRAFVEYVQPPAAPFRRV